MELGTENTLAREDPVRPDSVGELVESMIHHPVLKRLLSTVVSESPKVPARVWCGWWGRMVLMADRGGRLDDLGVPRLILWGGRDAFLLRRGGLSRAALRPLKGLTRTAGDDGTDRRRGWT